MDNELYIECADMMCRYDVDTRTQVGAWRSVMPNLRDNAWKCSRPKALVKISAS
jgi:hypothetical protein